MEENELNGSPVVFDMKIKDDDILSLIKKPIAESETYWNEKFGLAKVREGNMKLWLPKHNVDKNVYDYQEENLYEEPRIFVSTESLCAIVNSRIPMPSVAPAQDTETSVMLADDVRRSMFAYATKYQVQDIFRVATRNLVLKRAAYIKMRFDESVGKDGEIVSEIVMPEDIIVDKNAKWGEIPKFIAQRITDKTYEELLAYFPEAEQKIYELAGCNRRDSKGDLVAYKSQLAVKRTIFEVWIKYYDEGKYKSGVVWTDDNFNFVLGKMENPNWNYGGAKDVSMNVLDNPEPPFIPFNLFNDGSSYIDLTSLPEQAAAMQRIVDKRGFQIMNYADQASGGMVYNTQMITKAEIAQLSGDPTEAVGVNGPVTAAVTRIQAAPLPNYVFEDKIDARQQVDDIFGTHDVSRGKESGNRTLGQDKLQIGQDYTRIDDISRAILRSSVKYYRYLAQMMKVYYKKEHWFKLMGEDGQYDFVMMKSDLIEDGIDITVEEGSNMPLNHGEQLEFIVNLSNLGLVDPLTIYEVGAGSPMPSPKKMLERLMQFKTDPIGFAGLAGKEETERHAMADIMVLNAGELPELRNDITPEYLNYFTKYMMSPDYKDALKRKPEIKQLYAAYLAEVQKIAQTQMEQYMSQMPTQEELDNQAVKEAQHQEISNSLQSQQPQDSGQPSKPGQSDNKKPKVV